MSEHAQYVDAMNCFRANLRGEDKRPLGGNSYTWSGTEWIIKEAGPYVVLVTSMLFNDRVILSLTEDYVQQRGTIGGWCYDKGGAAMVAAELWDPLHELTPVGFKKEAFNVREELE